MGGVTQAELTTARRRDHASFLRTRWPARAGQLARVAAWGAVVLLAFDLADGAPPLRAAAARLPLLAIPAAGGALVRWAARWRGLPAAIVALVVAWTASADAGCFALATAPAVQSVVVLSCFVTAATFLPVAMRGRVAVFAAMAAVHLALSAAWPQARPLVERLGADAAVVAFAICGLFIFEGVFRSQRRAFELREALQATVADLSRFADEVAHQVYNPLSAVKVNVRWLGEAGAAPPAERAEVAQETLQAVERIEAIVATLERHADVRAEAAGAPPGRAGRAPRRAG